MADDDPADPPDPDAGPDRVQLSLAQVAASSLAAVSAAVVCSFFGVAGTIVGTAIASVCATVGSALYAHSLRRTRARLRRLHQAGASSPPLTEVFKTARQQSRLVLAQVQWRILLQGAATVFVFSIGLLTAFELTIGKPVSALLHGHHSGNRETTFGSALGQGHKRNHKAQPTQSPSPSPTATTSPSASSTGTPSQTPTSTPSASVTPTPSHTPTTPASSSTPTGSPSTSVTPSGTPTTGAATKR